MIDTLAFAKGAIFDYEEIVANRELERDKIRSAITPLLRGETRDSFHHPYYDPSIGKELLLFIQKGYDFGAMRTWVLRGICAKEDYDEDMEKEGLIQEWLEVEIE